MMLASSWLCRAIHFGATKFCVLEAIERCCVPCQSGSIHFLLALFAGQIVCLPFFLLFWITFLPPTVRRLALKPDVLVLRLNMTQHMFWRHAKCTQDCKHHCTYFLLPCSVQAIEPMFLACTRKLNLARTGPLWAVFMVQPATDVWQHTKNKVLTGSTYSY